MNLHRRHHFITNYRFRLSSVPSGGAHALLDSAAAALCYQNPMTTMENDDGDDEEGRARKCEQQTDIHWMANACKVEESHLVVVVVLRLDSSRPRPDRSISRAVQCRFIINSKTVSHSLFDAHLNEREHSRLPDDFEIGGICLHRRPL